MEAATRVNICRSRLISAVTVLFLIRYEDNVVQKVRATKLTPKGDFDETVRPGSNIIAKYDNGAQYQLLLKRW